ncbi:MAG TPA: cation:proton antiporter, partial [Pyrinomonadaceae bacterium]|nr:cation:proton antiporter [Pyrinomonadaceae bacterium]
MNEISLIDLARLFAALALLFVAARCMGRLFAYFHQPRVIGEIIGGLLLGPTFLSTLFPTASQMVFARTGFVPGALSVVSQLGLILLMFASGTELRSFLQRGERKIVG